MESMRIAGGAEAEECPETARLEGRSIAVSGFLLAGVATVAFAAALAYLLQPLRWPSTEGVVLSSSWMDATGNGSRGAVVAYEYEVDGTLHRSERLSLFRSANRYDAGSGQWLADDRRLVEDHPAGAPIEVRYDPDEPSRSVVVAHLNMPGIWGGAAILAVLWIGAITAWTRGARTKA